MAKGKQAKSKKKEEKEFSFLGLRIPGIDPSLFWRHLLLLVGLSILMKILVVFVTNSVLHSFLDLFDIGYYFEMAARVSSGQIPFVDFNYFYPPLSLIAFLIPYLGALAFNSVQAYIYTHWVLMCCFDLGTTLLVYLVALRFYDQRRAFVCGILSATAIAAAYFVLTKYDAFPTFFLMLSVALFLYRKEPAAYAASAVGFLVKWFPLAAYPYFLIHERLGGADTRTLVRRVLIGVIIFLIVNLPIMILSWEGFLFPYVFNSAPIQESRFLSQSQSLAFYLDYLVSPLGISPLFGKIVGVLMILVQLALIAIYWKMGSRDEQILTSFIFLAVLDFMVLNGVASPQYIIWVTPLLAILLAWSLPTILLFYAYQVWVFLEFPLMYNVLYTNQDWIWGTGGIPGAFFFFTVKYALIGAIVVIVAVRVRDRVRQPPAATN